MTDHAMVEIEEETNKPDLGLIGKSRIETIFTKRQQLIDSWFKPDKDGIRAVENDVDLAKVALQAMRDQDRVALDYIKIDARIDDMSKKEEADGALLLEVLHHINQGNVIEGEVVNKSYDKPIIEIPTEVTENYVAVEGETTLLEQIPEA